MSGQIPEHARFPWRCLSEETSELDLLPTPVWTGGFVPCGGIVSLLQAQPLHDRPLRQVTEHVIVGAVRGLMAKRVLYLL